MESMVMDYIAMRTEMFMREVGRMILKRVEGI